MREKIDIYRLSLYLKGDELDPDLLTRHIGIDPTQAHRKGSKWTTSSGRQVIEKTGLWAFTTQISENFSEEFRSLACRLTERVSALQGLPGVEDAYFDIFVAIDSEANGRADANFSISEECISALQRAGIPLNITFAAIPEG